MATQVLHPAPRIKRQRSHLQRKLNVYVDAYSPLAIARASARLVLIKNFRFCPLKSRAVMPAIASVGNRFH